MKHRKESALIKRVVWASLAVLLISVQVAHAKPMEMHIMEGFLPLQWAVFWFLIAVPFWVCGLRRITQLVAEKPETRLLLGLAGAFTFVLSALKLPSVTGSSSHPTGTGLGAIFFGPAVMSVIGSIVLVFQALLLAHGGLTTLGANVVSMAIVGPLVAWSLWHVLKSLAPTWLAVFLAAAFADLLTYVMTALQLALAYPDPTGGILASFVKFGAIFAITQVPLAISEGILTVLIVNALERDWAGELKTVGVKGG